MSKAFKELRQKMSLKAQGKAIKKAEIIMNEMPLAELRQAMRLTQEQLATELHVRQASVSKLERRTDMYISTLRNFIKAMGGDLEIAARFPEGSVKINQFEGLEPNSLVSSVDSCELLSKQTLS